MGYKESRGQYLSLIYCNLDVVLVSICCISPVPPLQCTLKFDAKLYLYSDTEGAAELCEVLASKIEIFQGDLNGQDIGIGLYGLQVSCSRFGSANNRHYICMMI